MPTALRGHGAGPRKYGTQPVAWGGWHAHGSAWAWGVAAQVWHPARSLGRVACPRLCVGMGGPWGALGHGAGTNHAHAKPWACHPAVGMPPGASMAHRP